MKNLFYIGALLMSIYIKAQTYYFSTREVISPLTYSTISIERGHYRMSFSNGRLSVYKNGRRQYIANWVRYIGFRDIRGVHYEGDKYYHTSRNKYLDIYIFRNEIAIYDSGVDALVLYY